MDYCLFTIGGVDYAAPSEALREVLMRPPVSKVPLAPPVLIGLAGFRGEALPLFDWKEATGEAGAAQGRDRVLMLAWDGLVAGFHVDDTDRVHDPEASVPGGDSLFSEVPIAGRPVRFVNLARLKRNLESLFEPLPTTAP